MIDEHTPGVFSYLDCSTAHLPQADVAFVDSLVKGTSVYERDSLSPAPVFVFGPTPINQDIGYGYWLYVNDDQEEDCPPAISEVMDFASRHGCVWIRLDPAGQRHPGLPVYEWN